MLRGIFGLRTVAVRGRSMLPALREGDFLLVRRGARVRPGAVAVGRLHDHPGLLVLKRVTRPADDGWVLASDNASAPGALSGPGQVEAVVLLRYWPPRRGRWRRVPGVEERS